MTGKTRARTSGIRRGQLEAETPGGSAGTLLLSSECEQDARERIEALAQLLDVRVKLSENHVDRREDGELIVLGLCVSEEEHSRWECAGITTRRVGNDGDYRLPGDENALGTFLSECIRRSRERRAQLGQYDYLRVMVAAWDRSVDSEELAWDISRDRGACLIEVRGTGPGLIAPTDGITWADISPDEQIIIPRILEDMPENNHVRLLSAGRRSGAYPDDPRIPRVIDACAGRSHVIVHAGTWNPQIDTLSDHVDAVILTGRGDERGLSSLCALTGERRVRVPCLLIPNSREICGHRHRLVRACPPSEIARACHASCGTPLVFPYPRSTFGRRKTRIKLWSALHHAVEYARI